MYCIGDVQGCRSALHRLLDEVAFSPSRDTVYLLGDLVNRGPDSLGVLRDVVGWEDAARCILGNHDLHLLATACGARKPGRRDTLAQVLAAQDAPLLLEWLAAQPLARAIHQPGQTLLLVHAGVLPSWTAQQTLALAAEVQSVLGGKERTKFLKRMYGDEPTAWDDRLKGMDRLRVVVNALTRLRFCSPDGIMEFDAKEGLEAAPPGYGPWFDAPNRRTQDVTVLFGHWSTLGWLDRSDVVALDSGCVWGGHLSALELRSGTAADPHLLIQVPCQQAQNPAGLDG